MLIYNYLMKSISHAKLKKILMELENELLNILSSEYRLPRVCMDFFLLHQHYNLTSAIFHGAV